MDLEVYLEECRSRVEGFLFEWLARQRDPLVSELFEAIEYALEGGKRIRAVLVMEGAELAGADPEGVLPTAAAVECFHAYSLVHDDLPAMDNDLERRGRPTVHIRFGEATAILVGDSLIPMGFELIGKEQLKFSPPERVLEVIALFSETLGPQGLTGGQLLDLDPAASKELYPEVNRRKTAALIGASVLAGAILGGLDRDRLSALRDFGVSLGSAYQLIDDLIDWEGDTKLGSREELRRQAEEHTEAALRALEAFGERAERLKLLTSHLASRRS